jgi:hypothetical protein
METRGAAFQMDKREAAGGLLLLAFAAAYGYSASSLPLFSTLGTGPGLFPMILAVLLALIALGLTIHACFTQAEHVELAPLPIRGIVFVSAAPIVFGVAMAPLGLLPALAIAVFVSAQGSRHLTLVAAIVLSIAVTLFCTTVFVWGLGLPLRLFGPWLVAD